MKKSDKQNKNMSKKHLDEHRKIEREIEDKSGIKDTIKLVVVVLIIFLVFYLLTVFILNKKSTGIVTTNPSIQYSKILAGESYNQNEDEYLVFYYDMSSDEASDYADLVSTYRDKDKHLTIYTVDLNEGMNKKYVSSDEEKLDASSITELKIKSSAIIRFKNNQPIDSTTSSFGEFLDNNVE